MKDFEFEPTGQKILVKLQEKELAGGISIPDSAKQKSQMGTVIAIGPTVLDKVMKEGDTVLFGKYALSELEINGEKYFIINEPDLFGKIRKK